jgi:formyl-CoA transferase
VLASLVERERSGEGQNVELSLYESVLRIMEWTVAGFDRLGIVRARTGNRLANSAPLDNYATADGRYVCIAAAGDVLFPRLAQAMGQPDLVKDERFSSLEARARNADAINEIVAAWCAGRTLDEIEGILIDAQVPVSGVYSIDQIVADAQVRARGSIVTVDDPVLGPVRQQAPVPRLDRTPARVARGAPRLGEHNETIYLGLLGMTRAEYDDLKRNGVI